MGPQGPGARRARLGCVRRGARPLPQCRPRARSPARARRAGGRSGLGALGRRVCLPGSRNTCCRAPGPSLRPAMPPASSRGPSAAPECPAAAGLRSSERGAWLEPGRKWREKGLFRVARHAEGLAGPSRQPAGRVWFRFRSQPAAPVNSLNLAPGGGNSIIGAHPPARGGSRPLP